METNKEVKIMFKTQVAKPTNKIHNNKITEEIFSYFDVKSYKKYFIHYFHLNAL